MKQAARPANETAPWRVRASRLAGRRDAGFALLVALLVAAVALLAVAVLATAVVSTTAIAGDDAAGARAADAARSGVADVVARLRWSWLPPADADAGALDPVALDQGGAYRAAVERVDALEPQLTPDSAVAVDDPGIARYRVTVTGTWGHASRTTLLTAVAIPDGLPRGLVVAGDAAVEAPLGLQGCGLYAGGDVSGREHVTLTSPPPDSGADATQDLAYGGLYDQAAVHARGRIYARGQEEHEAGAAVTGDTDLDAGLVPPVELVAGPGPAALGDLAAHASDATSALTPDGLDLSLLDAAAPAAVGAPILPAGGRVYVVGPSGAGPTPLFGARPPAPGACPVTVVVLGDGLVTAGPLGDRPAALTGSLVVTGSLTVAAPLEMTGGLSASRLVVRSPLRVTFEPWSGQGSPPGTLTVRTAVRAE